MSVPFHTFRTVPFDHTFLSEGIEFSVVFKSFFYHSSLLYPPCFWEWVDVACQTCLLSSCIALSFHTTRKKQLYPYSLLGRGLILYIYIPIFFSTVSSIILHCSITPCFWEGVDFACQTFPLSSCIALSFHTTRKNYPTLVHSFGRGLTLYI